jgi:predicted membrane channel-forming protein YqfA (hemolysin III family)
MATESDKALTDKGKLLFGAGFVFGVMATMLLLAAVLAATSSANLGSFVGSSVVVTLAAGVVFATIVGAGLYLLAFPENRTKIPVDPEQFGRDGE